MEKAFIKTKPCKKIETFDADKKPNGWVLEIVSDKDNFTKHIRGQIYLTVVEPGLFKGYHVHAAADLFIRIRIQSGKFRWVVTISKPFLFQKDICMELRISVKVRLRF